MNRFKYATEAGLKFRLDRFVMCQQDEFKDIEASPYHFQFLASCNIYFICRRNRIGIIPNSLVATNEAINLNFQFWEGDSKFDFPISFKNTFRSTKLSIDSRAPHSVFKILNDNGEIAFESKASYVADDYRVGIYPNANFLDFEILYIGKAMDKSAKPTFNRLIKHESLQKIYSENSPDKEIFLLLFPLFVSGDIEITGAAHAQQEYEAENKKRSEKFLSTGLEMTHDQQVSIAEAALIKYFEPEYNEHHKRTFPTKKNSSYDQLYKMDFNIVTIEVDTTAISLNTHFYTPKAKTSQIHSYSYFLPTEADRRKLFEYCDRFKVRNRRNSQREY